MILTHLTRTFDHAITILQESDDPATSLLLDKFLELNGLVLRQPLPYRNSNAIKPEDEINKINQDFTLRSVKYQVTNENKKDSIKVANILKLDPKESLRMISQISMRIPEDKKIGRSTSKINDLQGLKDDISDIYESERIQLYCSMVLRERRSVLKLVILLLQNRNNQFFTPYVQQLGSELSGDHQFVAECIKSLEILINSITKEEYLTNFGTELDELVASETFLLVIDLLKVLVNLFVNSVIHKDLVLVWFQFVTKTNFLSSISKTASYDTLSTISALATIATVLLVDLESNFGDLTDEFSYMNDPKILHQMTQILMNSPTNPLVIYSWSFILHRKSLVIESFPANPVAIKMLSLFDNDIEKIKVLYKSFASKANELDVCDAIVQCHQILKFDAMYTAILGSYIISMLPYIDLTPKIASVIGTVLSDAPEHIIKKFFSDETSERLIILSRAKLPVSLASYIKICNINGVFGYEEFSVLKSYMESFNELDLFNKYEFDEYNPELVQFNENIDVFPPYEKAGELSLLLEKGIKGKLIPTDNENEQVVIFLYEYNGLSLIGRVLQNLLRGYNPNDFDKNDLTIDILKLITKILDQCPKTAQEDTISVMSAFVDGEDIFKIIFEIFDKALLDRNIEFLVPLVNLLTALLENFSDKVWTYLKKSTLLENGSKGGSISVILGAIEMVHGKYDFTISIIELCNGLISNCFNVNNEILITLREEILGKLIIHLIQIFESFTHWKYTEIYQKLKIGTLISDIFSRTLISAYGIGENANVREKPTKVFAQAAENIVSSFLIPVSKEVRSNRPIILMIESVSVALLSYQTNDASGMWCENWIRSCFELATLLITTRSILGLKPSKFEESIFGQSQNLVEIYSQYVSLRKYAIRLLTSLVSAKWPNEPPSLLAHLGNYHANMLIKSMSIDLNNNFDDLQMKVYVYDLFAAVMDGNFQEGLSIMFITGRDIRDSINSSKENKTSSILSILKKHITQIYEYPDTVGLHLVEAIALAFNSWTTAKEDDNDKEFIGQLIKRLRSSSNIVESEDYVSKSYEFKLISKIAEILALYLFVSQNQECVKDIEALVTDEKFMDLIATNFKITGYQPILHSNLHREFETKWPNYKLLQFVRSTLVKTRRYGVGSVYDISLMDELFKQEEDWISYRESLVSASINLRYVESQMIAAKSMGALLTSYCNRNNKKPLGKSFLKMVAKLLELNESSLIVGGDEIAAGVAPPIFNEIYQERIELAFFLIYKASANAVVDDDGILYNILKSCCHILTSNDLDLIAGFADGDTVRYRPLLRTLLAALKLVSKQQQQNKMLQNADLFHDLFSLIVSKSLRYLFSSIQNDALTSYNSRECIQDSAIINKKMNDVLLILSIVKTFVKLPLTSDLKLNCAESLVEHGLIKSILNLYSCSHLIKFNDDVVFADLTLLFIYELISIREIAEKFMQQGLFSILVESPISTMIQKGGIRANISPNYHHIWTNGLLSILLTLLSIFGEKLIPDAVMFITYFIKQIETNINNWYQDSIVITNATIQETGQIVLLYKVLQLLNVDEYLVTYNINNCKMDEQINFIPGLDDAEQRQGLINVFNYLLSHPKFLSLRVAPTNVEENWLFEKDNKKFVDSVMMDIKDLKNSLTD